MNQPMNGLIFTNLWKKGILYLKDKYLQGGQAMQKAYYELLKKYAKMMTEQDYPVGEAARLLIGTSDGVFATRDGADLSDLKAEDVEKLPVEHLPMSRKGMSSMVFSQTPYCQKCLADARPFRASVDDMAQIIGPAVYITGGRSADTKAGKSMVKAFKNSTGAFVLRSVDKDGKGIGYTVTVGRTPYEAVVGMTVLEKSAEITALADKIGGAKELNRLDAHLMHKIYQKKYSKAEAGVKKKEVTPGKAEQPVQVSTSEKAEDKPESLERKLREKLCEYGKKLVETGLVQGTWGNLSVRLDDKYMLVTPSGLDYTRLTPADMVKVNIETLEYEGSLKPTSEKGLHAEVYKQRPDSGAVIHTHSKYCCVFAAAEKDLPIEDAEMQKIFGKQVKLAEYALPGTKKLMTNTVKALGHNFGCIMSHHGMAACGADIETAFDYCVKLEECGRIALGM